MEPLTEEDLREMVLRLAHEIRNPLATIQSGIQLVQHLLKAPGGAAASPEEIEEYLASALDEVRRIDHTVRDLQRFVRLGTRTASHRIEVRRLVEEALGRIAHDGARKEPEVRLVRGPACQVVADFELLATALVELLQNALGVSPPEGTVTVGWRIRERRVELVVEDDGPGVADENREKILRPFFSTSTQGTGLGLSVVQRVCKLSQGGFQWENRQSGGCRFTMILPEA